MEYFVYQKGKIVHSFTIPSHKKPQMGEKGIKKEIKRELDLFFSNGTTKCSPVDMLEIGSDKGKTTWTTIKI